MKSSAKKVELAPYDDLFSTEESRQDAKLEKVREIPLSELHPFKNHPFKVKDDEAMMETADSVRQYGVLVPAIARPDPEGGYELVAGHRRHRASELAEKETMPVIVRDLDDDAATIIMVDSNLQRESLLPSERAFAYKMKLEAMKHQGERMDLTCSQVGNKSAGKKSSELLAEQVGQSKNQIFRYIRLTELIPELLDMVDEKKIALNPAYELSFLKKEEQRDLLDAMDSEQATPSLSQAQRLKKYSQEGHLTLDMMRVIMGEEKKSDLDKVTLSADILRKYFPKSYTPQRMQETIIKLLEGWQMSDATRTAGAKQLHSLACFIVPIAAARCMSTAPTTASVFLNIPAHSTPKFLAERYARPSTVSMKMWYCPLFQKCSKPLQNMPSMTELSLSVWCRKRSPASKQQRLRNSAHALLPLSRGFPSWKSCSAKSMRTTF